MAQALADTSVFVAREVDRPMRVEAIPELLAVSVITIGELRAGVLAADDASVRARRLATLTDALMLEPFPIDDDVAAAWADLRVRLRDQRLRMPVNDSWIAATAMARRLPVLTQDEDFPEVAGLDVIRV